MPARKSPTFLLNRASPEKVARAPGLAPWSYYSMKDGRPFFMAGLWSDAPDMASGEITDTYTVIITDANDIIRVHDRMPAIMATEAASVFARLCLSAATASVCRRGRRLRTRRHLRRRRRAVVAWHDVRARSS